MKLRFALLPVALVASPAMAQHHDHGSMEHEVQSEESTDDAAEEAHAGSDHSTRYDLAEPPAAPADEPGDAPPPPVPSDHAADALFDRAAMLRAREGVRAESRFWTTALMLDVFEFRAREGDDGYRIEGMMWTGGDIDRAVIALDAEGAFGEAAESIEIDGYWSHAINPWFNLQLGARHDLRPDPERTYALVGLQGVLPYWIEGEGQLFVSGKGDVHLSATASHDLRVTQRLVVEPEVELDVAMQDVPELGIGAGFDKIELSARARYELARNFAPYIGISWERKLGGSADFARIAGEKPSVVSLLVGLRAWF